MGDYIVLDLNGDEVFSSSNLFQAKEFVERTDHSYVIEPENSPGTVFWHYDGRRWFRDSPSGVVED